MNEQTVENGDSVDNEILLVSIPTCCIINTKPQSPILANGTIIEEYFKTMSC